MKQKERNILEATGMVCASYSVELEKNKKKKTNKANTVLSPPTSCIVY